MAKYSFVTASALVSLLFPTVVLALPTESSPYQGSTDSVPQLHLDDAVTGTPDVDNAAFYLQQLGIDSELISMFKSGKLRGRWYDLECTNGFKTTCGSLIHDRFTPTTEWYCSSTPGHPIKDYHILDTFTHEVTTKNLETVYQFNSVHLANLLIGLPVCLHTAHATEQPYQFEQGTETTIPTTE